MATRPLERSILDHIQVLAGLSSSLCRVGRARCIAGVAAGEQCCAMLSGFWALGVLTQGLVSSHSYLEGAPEDSGAVPPSEKKRAKAPAANKGSPGKGKTGRARVKTNCGPASQWTAEEHARFLVALDKFGNVETQAAGAEEHCEGEPAQRRGGGLGKSAILISFL